MKCPECGNIKYIIEIDLNICCLECFLDKNRMVIMIDEQKGICYCKECNS